MNHSDQGNHPKHGSKKTPGRGDEIVCLCNEVKRETIENAIRGGANTLNKIFDRTQAGVGPCGGSCRQCLGPMLDHYLKTGTFPEGKIRPQQQKKKR